MEGHLYRKTGKFVLISEQQILDCQEYGCDGGFMLNAFDYEALHGITSESTTILRINGSEISS